MFSTFITTCLLASTLVSSASAPSLDAATLLSNGQEAQTLNALFQTLNSSDPCADGDKACIDGAIASCGNGTWDITRGRCAKTQNCFAVPDTRKAGTILSCTSEKGAISAIEATGATGGILGTTNTTSTSTTDGSTGKDDGRGTSNSTSTSTATSLSITPPVTVTVTLTAQVTTLPPKTRTLSPKEASSLLASLMAEGATIINPPSTASTMSANAVIAPTLGSQSTGVTSSDIMSPTDLPSEPAKVDSSVMATSSVSFGGY